MTEWKSKSPSSSSSQSSIAAMKNFLQDGRLIRLSSPPSPLHPLSHPQTNASPHAWRVVGNGGGRRVRQDNTSLANITSYYRGRNTEQTPPPFPSMSYSSSIYTLFYSVIYNSVVCAKYQQICSYNQSEIKETCNILAVA